MMPGWDNCGAGNQAPDMQPCLQRLAQAGLFRRLAGIDAAGDGLIEPWLVVAARHRPGKLVDQQHPVAGGS